MFPAGACNRVIYSYLFCFHSDALTKWMTWKIHFCSMWVESGIISIDDVMTMSTCKFLKVCPGSKAPKWPLWSKLNIYMILSTCCSLFMSSFAEKQTTHNALYINSSTKTRCGYFKFTQKPKAEFTAVIEQIYRVFIQNGTEGVIPWAILRLFVLFESLFLRGYWRKKRRQ